MFQNVMSPSQVYQSLFRTLPLVPQPSVATTSASFLVENLLREGQSALISRPVTSFPAGLAGFANVGVTTVPALGRSMEHVAPVSSPASSINSNNVNNVTPYLKFGVNAILGSETTNSKSSKYLFVVILPHNLPLFSLS